MLSLIIGIILVSISGASKAIMDKLQFHYHKCIFKFNPVKYDQKFWDPTLSWETNTKKEV